MEAALSGDEVFCVNANGELSMEVVDFITPDGGCVTKSGIQFDENRVSWGFENKNGMGILEPKFRLFFPVEQWMREDIQCQNAVNEILSLPKYARSETMIFFVKATGGDAPSFA